MRVKDETIADLIATCLNSQLTIACECVGVTAAAEVEPPGDVFGGWVNIEIVPLVCTGDVNSGGWKIKFSPLAFKLVVEKKSV